MEQMGMQKNIDNQDDFLSTFLNDIKTIEQLEELILSHDAKIVREMSLKCGDYGEYRKQYYKNPQIWEKQKEAMRKIMANKYKTDATYREEKKKKCRERARLKKALELEHTISDYFKPSETSDATPLDEETLSDSNSEKTR